MEYRIIKKDVDGFWEDKKTASFGLDSNLTITIDKNIISIESQGAALFLLRDGKKAKVSTEGKIIKGIVKDNDKLFLEDQLFVEFSDSAKRNLKIRLPKINWNLWVGVSILLLLAVVIFTGWKKRTETNMEISYQKMIADVKGKILQSENIKSMDPETSLKLLNEAKTGLPSTKNSKKHSDEILEIEKQITEKLVVAGSSEIEGYVEIYNSKIADTIDRKYDKMVVSSDEAILGESKTGKVVDINLSTGLVTRYEITADLPNFIDINIINKRVYAYDGRAIWSIQNKIEKVVDVGDEVFLRIVNWNKTWYLLGQDGKINKLTDGRISRWTSEVTGLISNPVDMTIDGNVWVIGQSGEIVQYEKGEIKKWNPSAKIVDEKIVGISTTPDSQKIAIASEKMIRIYEKSNGKLLTSYNFGKVGIMAAKMGNNDQIFVLGLDQKIYKVK